MKKKAGFLFCTLLLLLLSAGTAFAKTPKYSLTTSTIKVQEDHRICLAPAGIPARKIKWRSLNNRIADVDDNGVLIAYEIGQTTMIGKYKGLKFKVNVICYSPIPSKSPKLLLREDKNIAVYLQKTKKNKLCLRIKNKTGKNLGYAFDRLRITSGGLAYKNEDLHFRWIPAHKSMSQEVSLKQCGAWVSNDDIHIDMTYYTSDHKEHPFRIAENDLKLRKR
ncbi:MAG: hypothetical protein K6E84_08225 [Lachnospiraceae bacterium]|nr:hypothetical protein [Lachnospiraceae bacterium]